MTSLETNRSLGTASRGKSRLPANGDGPFQHPVNLPLRDLVDCAYNGGFLQVVASRGRAGTCH
jgi:hypothetical protein